MDTAGGPSLNSNKVIRSTTFFADQPQPSSSQGQGAMGDTNSTVRLTEQDDAILDDNLSNLKSKLARFFNRRHLRDEHRSQGRDYLAYQMGTSMQ